MAEASDRYCPVCGRISPPHVQMCQCGERFSPTPGVQLAPLPEGPAVVFSNGRENLASVGMFLSIAGVCLFRWWPIALTCSVGGFILSLAALNSNRRGMAITGLVLGIIGLTLAVLSALGIFDLLMWLWKIGARPRIIHVVSTGS